MKISPKQFAAALFESLNENEIEKNLNSLKDVLDEKRGIKNILNNPKINSEEKIKILKDLGFSEKLSNFLILVNDNNAIEKIPQITECFTKLRNANTNSVDVEVITAKKLSKEEILALSTDLEKIFSKKIFVTNKIKEDIIGGIIIKISDWLIDNSIKTQLAKLKYDLLEK